MIEQFCQHSSSKPETVFWSTSQTSTSFWWLSEVSYKLGGAMHSSCLVQMDSQKQTIVHLWKSEQVWKKKNFWGQNELLHVAISAGRLLQNSSQDRRIQMHKSFWMMTLFWLKENRQGGSVTLRLPLQPKHPIIISQYKTSLGCFGPREFWSGLCLVLWKFSLQVWKKQHAEFLQKTKADSENLLLVWSKEVIRRF